MARKSKKNKQFKKPQRNRNGMKQKSKYFTDLHKSRIKRKIKRLDKETYQEYGTDIIHSPTCPSSVLETPSPDIISPGTFTTRLGRDFFDTPTETLAVALLGKLLCRVTDQGEKLCGKIVETEAYLGVLDPACHSYGGRRTERNKPTYGPPGMSYVYFIYGMYHCFNISSKENGACVLIRALEPVEGLDCMKRLRSAKRKSTSKVLKDHELANGPSKLCTAMNINKQNLNNADLTTCVNFWIEDATSDVFTVLHTTRIGIESYGKESALKPYRYYIFGNKHVSVRDKTAEAQLIYENESTEVI